MIFTNIFSKWKESLDLFKKESFKLFLLVSLNNTKRSVSIFLRKFWWLCLLVLVSFFVGSTLLLGSNFISILFFNKTGFPIVFQHPSGIYILFGLLSMLVSIISSGFLAFFIFLIVRPSIEAKDSFYFKKHINRVFGFSFIMFFLFFLSFLFVSIIGLKYIKTNLLFKFFSGFLGVIFAFSVFFFLDSQKKMSSVFVSVFRALKAFVYFFPVFIFLHFVSLFFNLFFSFIFPFLSEMLIKGGIVSFVFVIIGIILFIVFGFIIPIFNLSLIVNYYTMLKHKYYKLLYK